MRFENQGKKLGERGEMRERDTSDTSIHISL